MKSGQHIRYVSHIVYNFVKVVCVPPNFFLSPPEHSWRLPAAQKVIKNLKITKKLMISNIFMIKCFDRTETFTIYEKISTFDEKYDAIKVKRFT